MKRINSLILLAGLGAMVATGLESCHKKENAAPAELARVDVAYPEVDSLVLHKTFPGYLSSNRSVDLVARVDGYLVSHPYESGAFVRKGAVLFKIEETNYLNQVKEAEATLASAQAQLAYAVPHYAAMKKALESDAVSEMEVAQAKSDMDAAEASVAQAKAALNTARTQLGYCTVRAPFDGYVSTNKYDDGTFLAGSGSPVVLATIYDDAQMVVNFRITDESYLELVRQASAEFDVDLKHVPLNFSDSLPNKYTASIDYLAPNIEKSTGTMLIQGLVDNPNHELRNGMYTSVSLPYAVNPRAVTVKSSALGTDQRGSYLYTLTDSNTVVYTAVTVGETVNDTITIVNSGLRPDQRYVTKALLKVRQGMKVDPIVTNSPNK